jgi:dihydrofolate reductase
MAKLVVHMQTTVDNRIANGEGTFWEPFPWGDEEQDWLNASFRQAGTWAMSRPLYEAVVPWWETVHQGKVPDDVPDVSQVYQDFAAILHDMDKVVFSRTLEQGEGRTVVGGDLADELAALKERATADVLLSCGPSTLAPLAAVPGLVDEYLLVVHPAAISSGPRLFGELGADLGFRLSEAKVFDGGCVVLRYAVLAG